MSFVVKLLVQPINFTWKSLFSSFSINFDRPDYRGVDQAMRFNQKAHEDRLRNTPFL